MWGVRFTVAILCRECDCVSRIENALRAKVRMIWRNRVSASHVRGHFLREPDTLRKYGRQSGSTRSARVVNLITLEASTVSPKTRFYFGVYELGQETSNTSPTI